MTARQEGTGHLILSKHLVKIVNSNAKERNFHFIPHPQKKYTENDSKI
jgi:hypothetical protein